jgi:hypothetical protein
LPLASKDKLIDVPPLPMAEPPIDNRLPLLHAAGLMHWYVNVTGCGDVNAASQLLVEVFVLTARNQYEAEFTPAI